MKFRQVVAPIVMAAVVLGLMAPASVAAEDERERPIYEPTDEQLELNEQGVEALIEGNPARAVALLTEAYRLGEVNILALNLGRAHHALGNCEEARHKLGLVAELPVVDHPPPERIEQRADEYLEDIDESCRDDEETDIDDPEEMETIESPAEIEDDQRDWWARNQRDVGMITTISGVTTATGGLVLHLIARQQHGDLNEQVSGDDEIVTDMTQSEYLQQQAQIGRLDTFGIAAGAVGLGTAVAGAVLWVTADDTGQPSARLDLSVDRFGAGIDWMMRF